MLDIKKMIRLGKSKFEISKKIVTMRRKMIIPRMLDIKKMVIIKVIMITMEVMRTRMPSKNIIIHPHLAALPL